MTTFAISAETPLFADLPPARLARMAEAGRRVRECEEMLAKQHTSIVSVLLGDAEFFQWDHYPDGDVYDGQSHSQYYYHAHQPNVRTNLWGDEHGHFHTFLRPQGFPDGLAPLPLTDPAAGGEHTAGEPAHLVAISINHAGEAMRLFSPNRWVTGETWHDAASMKQMLPLFRIDQPVPSWPVNIWITNMLILFGPSIESLLDARDRAIAAFVESHPDVNVYESRNLEVASMLEISVDDQIAAVEKALAGL